jgi:hypothetical protein
MFRSKWSSREQINICSFILLNDIVNNMRQAQPVWRMKSNNFKREAWEGNVFFFFKYFLKFFFIIWLELSLIDLWLFRSFYLRRSSAENLVERDFLIRILFQVYLDFA